MPHGCSAYGCSNYCGKEECQNLRISFHKFPLSNRFLVQQWLLNIKRVDFVPTANSKICSDHFEESCFEYRPSGKRMLKKYAIPTKFSFELKKNARKRTVYTEVDEETESFPEEDERPKLWEIQLPQNSQATKFSKLGSTYFIGDSFDKTGGSFLKSTAVSKTFDFPYHLKESEEKRLSLSSEDSIDGQLEGTSSNHPDYVSNKLTKHPDKDASHSSAQNDEDVTDELFVEMDIDQIEGLSQCTTSQIEETSGKEANILKLKTVTEQDYEELSIIKQIEDDIRKEFLSEMQETVQNSEISKDEDDELLNVQLELNQAYTEINILTKTKDVITKELSAAFKRQKSLVNTISQKDEELSKLKLELEQANANINIISAEKYSFVEKLEMALSNQKILENMLSERPELEKNLKQAFAEIDALRKERDELIEKQTAANATKAILNDPNKLRYYTGLKSVEDFFSLLMLLDKFKHETNNIPIETKILIVLMRLRGHYKYGDLAYRFDTTGGTISRVCDRIIPFLGRRLDDLINDPTHDVFKKNLPVGFKINVYEDLLQKIQKYSKVENKKFWSEI